MLKDDATSIDLYSLGDESANFTSALDRSPLGSFAVSSELFSAADFLYRVMNHVEFSGEDPMGYLSRAENRLRVLCRDAGTSLVDAVGEIGFWRGFSKSLLMVTDIAGVAYDIHVAQLKLVYAYPHMHDYFVAGIWDVGYIDNCVTNDVDVEIALSLIAS